jgi:hypothetical protein
LVPYSFLSFDPVHLFPLNAVKMQIPAEIYQRLTIVPEDADYDLPKLFIHDLFLYPYAKILILVFWLRLKNFSTNFIKYI